ncbi:TonB-dependent receptor [Cyclobacterium marinum DSM 745]|uniref:TonB-dependent receptor n=2 Tax=Cyclobacterium marinum TaxID=104 RepID=G0J4D5_CYCMS|nr:TonB-dependent receptor [Cyclobacterium marinum DSM 745]
MTYPLLKAFYSLTTVRVMSLLLVFIFYNSSAESPGDKKLALLFPTSSTVYKAGSSEFDIVITGRVTDQNGNSIPGATVSIPGTSIGTATDIDGNYTLEVPEDATLLFSFIGFLSQEIEVGSKSIINVVLVENQTDLDEVVVIGYGTQKKSDLTGAVMRVDAKTFQNQNVTQLSEMLTGTVAGFNANQGTSASGGSSLEVRGPTSLSAGTSPLIVLDGVIFNGSLQDINPNDIETMDILKDASSAAVFGSRAASGVILITTSKGKSGKPTINFTTQIGIAEVTNNDVRPLNKEEYTDFRRDLLIKENPDSPPYFYNNPNDLPSDISLDQWINYNNNPNADNTIEWLNRLLFFPEETENYLAGTGVNWYDEVMQKGLRQNYDLSLSGGSEKIKYYWSLGSINNEGIITGDDFFTIRSRLNLDAEVTDWLKVGLNSQFSERDESNVQANLGQMLISSPYGSKYEEDGSVKWFPNGYIGAQNPLINHLNQDKSRKIQNLFATLYAELELPYGFSYRVSFQPRYTFLKDLNFWNSETILGGQTRSRGFGTREDSQTFEWMVDNLLKWNKRIGIHNFDVTVLYNVEKFQSWLSYQSGETFNPNQNLSFHGLQFATNHLVNNNDVYSTGDAFMGRLNYTLMDKYLFTGSIRRDGYSAFGQQNPRAVFPAGAFAWKISDESFFNSASVENLKLRLSWGINGNRDIGRYSALARLSQNLYSNGSQVLVGVYNNSLANPGLVWEKTEAFNLGLDLGLWEGKLNASLEVYSMVTEDLLMERNLPQVTGFDNITTNLGELENKGIEFTLNSVNLNTNNFTWKSDFVFSMNRNKIVSLFGDYEEVEVNGEIVEREISDIANQWFIGEALDRVWNYDITGIWQMDEADEAQSYGLSPGDYKAVDVNGDGSYTTLEDKQFIGWTQPRYRLGFRNNFTFLQNFTASIFIRADLGHIGGVSDFLHNSSNLYDRRGMRAIPYWTEANPSSQYGSLTATSGAYGGGYNLYFSRSFVRIQDLSLSYNIPSALLQKMRLDNLRLFGSVRNLYSFDKWENWDPESGGSPMPRVYSMGLNVTF